MKSTDIVSAYKGSNAINKIYLGDTVVWPREPFFEFDCLGAGTLLNMDVTNTAGYVGVVIDDTELRIYSKTNDTQYTTLNATGEAYNKNYPIASSYKINCQLPLFKKRVIKISKRNSDNQRYVADTKVGIIIVDIQNPFDTNFNISISLTGKGTQTHSVPQNQSKRITFSGLAGGTYTITITDNDTGAVSTKALSVGIGYRSQMQYYAIDFGEYTNTSPIPKKIQIYPLTESEAETLAFGNGCVVRMHVQKGPEAEAYRTTNKWWRVEFILYSGGSGYPPNARIPISTRVFTRAWQVDPGYEGLGGTRTTMFLLDANETMSNYFRLIDLITDETGTVVDLKRPLDVDQMGTRESYYYAGGRGYPAETGSWIPGLDDLSRGFYTYRADSRAEFNQFGADLDRGKYTAMNEKYGYEFQGFYDDTLTRTQSYSDYILNGKLDIYAELPSNTMIGLKNSGYDPTVFTRIQDFIDEVQAQQIFTPGFNTPADTPPMFLINGDDVNNILGGSDGLISENTLASAINLTGDTTSIKLGSVPVQRIKAQSQRGLIAFQSDSYGTNDDLRSNRPDSINISGSKKIEALHGTGITYNYS
jgi:hypothetical protein